MYSLELDLTGRRVLVVGLGRIGMRKAEGLIAAGAVVLAVDPAPPPGLATPLFLRAEPYRADHLDGVALAFAAGPPEINDRVVADAKARGVWVNSASRPDRGDFLVPASWRDGPISVAVSTSGASPALAGELRDRAAAAIGPAAASLAHLLIRLRAEVLATVPDPDRRRRLLLACGASQWLKVAESESPELLEQSIRACMSAL